MRTTRPALALLVLLLLVLVLGRAVSADADSLHPDLAVGWFEDGQRAALAWRGVTGGCALREEPGDDRVIGCGNGAYYVLGAGAYAEVVPHEGDRFYVRAPDGRESHRVTLGPPPTPAYPAPAQQPPIAPSLSAIWTADPTRLEVRYAAGEPVTVEWLLRPELALNPPEQVGVFTLCACAPDAWYKPVPGRVLVLWSSDRRELARTTVSWPYRAALPLATTPIP